MIDTEEYTVKINDRIVGKKIGVLVPSTVIGIVTPQFYLNGVLKISMDSTLFLWDEYYPNWKDKLVVIGSFDEPQIVYTFEEISKRYKDNPNSFFNLLKNRVELTKKQEEEILKLEYMTVDKSWTVAYPIDDVEII